MNRLLTAQRLVELSHFHPKLQNLWYLVAATTFSVCNEPQEIPKLYHYAMMVKGPEATANQDLAKKTMDMFRKDSQSLKLLFNEMYCEPTSLQTELTEKLREALLKSSALSGLPKAINSLSHLKEATPIGLLSKVKHIDPSSSIPLFHNTKRCANESTNESAKEGLKHWSHIYSKVSEKVINNLNSSYPDLWYYTISHVYGPLLSFDGVLNAQETSLIIVASLVPQDVNPQLWGHLKGAVNVGCDKEVIEAVRSLSVMVAQWCGVEWKNEVVKL